MKTIPPPCPEPETGQKYWRSLDQLAETPEFRQWVEREFPAGASEFTDPVSRRHFVKIMSASFMLAGFGLTGCRRPEEKIVPFSKMPENYAHGVPQYYATAMPARGSAVPLVVKSHDGRPTKIEGNSQHPDSNGGTDVFTQASILNLYDPDRAQRFTKDGNTTTREAAMDLLAAVSKQFAANGGEGLAFLAERSSSPSRARLQAALVQKFPKARWHVYEPVDLDLHRTVAGNLSGTPLNPHYMLDQAKVILSLDCDFVGAEEDSYRLIRGFAKGRKLEKPGDPMSRLYAVEGLMTLTGINADHRLRVPTSAVMSVAAALAAQIAPDNPAIKPFSAKFPIPGQVNAKWIEECAKDLVANKGASLVLAGYRQPRAVHAITHLLNAALQNVGKTVVFQEAPVAAGLGLVELGQSLTANQVDTLVILGSNPVYNAPVDLDWANTQRKAKTVVRLGYYEDETFPACTWHFPAAHYLESWGDARTSDGTLVPIQPLIEPLFGGINELEMLARLAGLPQTSPYDIVRETLRAMGAGADFENNWKKFLHDGFLTGSAAKVAAAPAFAPDKIAEALNSAPAIETPGKDKLEVVFHRDYSLDDGRYSNNGWLQELPDPITKLTWDNVVLVSRKTASELGLKNGDVVEIDLGGRKIKGPIWIQPGFADYSLGLALGYGRERGSKGGIGRVGHKVGSYDAYQLRTSAAPHSAVGAKLRKTGETYQLSCTQEHGSMEGRPIIREANLEDFKKHPKFARNMDLESHFEHIPKDPKTGEPKMIYEHPYQAYEQRKSQVGVDLSKQLFKSDVHQWGMSIDLNSCVGCSACVMACQSENNIPIVGKEQVFRNREMHWLRIDRYYSGWKDNSFTQLVDDPQVVTQPMLCQHCENAPCESVCPVNATVHDEEGLNVMAYNRCVGTRYCSNNCPYKVRRFNFFDYTKRPLNKLYASPLTSFNEGEWELKRWWKDVDKSNRPEDEWELLKLVRNPDVSVRMRGIMEKCTFCVQRIEQAKIAQKVKAGASGDVQVREGAIQTACQQACPAEAIVFGNLLDPKSRVTQLKKQERDYSVLGFLDTRPRLTYLARIRNPNPAMPDYHQNPLNIQEYIDKQGSPFEEHGASQTKHGASTNETKKGAH